MSDVTQTFRVYMACAQVKHSYGWSTLGGDQQVTVVSLSICLQKFSKPVVYIDHEEAILLYDKTSGVQNLCSLVHNPQSRFYFQFRISYVL